MQERRVLRNAAKAALLGKTRAGSKVESSRPNPLSQQPSALGGTDELPVIVIYTRTTKSDVFDESPRRYKHKVELIVECALAFSPGSVIDDDLDGFEDEVLRALLVDETLGGAVDDLQLVGSSNVINGEGDRLLGAVVVTMEATVYTIAPYVDTLDLPDLTSVNTQYNLSGDQPDEADRAKSNIEGLDQ
ncbi:MAG: hypothetical protein ACRC6L_02325 [Steroidobacteraceae bacterium]